MVGDIRRQILFFLIFFIFLFFLIQEDMAVVGYIRRQILQRMIDVALDNEVCLVCRLV